MDTMDSLHGFLPDSVISESSVHKSMTVLGRFEGKEGRALVLLVRRPFPADMSVLNTAKLKHTSANDIYYKYAASVSDEHVTFDVSVIFPCTERHIDKYSSAALEVLLETPKLYRSVTKPFIDAMSTAGIQWVYDILDQKAEMDNVVMIDTDPVTGFVLLPDSKWNREQTEDMYCLAIVNCRSLKCIRDLDATHLPLLEGILSKGAAKITEKFGVPAKKQRIYFHYQPSYYHLHVHFVHTNLDATHGMVAGKAHMLHSVIDNIKMVGDYYTQATLPVVFSEKDKLLAALRQAQNGEEVAAKMDEAAVAKN